MHGAEPCPRKHGHRGEHYWWIPWQDGRGQWRVVVYSGDLSDDAVRRRRARGVFVGRPTAYDVNRLLALLSPMKKAQVARRRPESEPEPPPPIPHEIRRLPNGLVAIYETKEQASA